MAFARIVSRFVFALLWLGLSTAAFAQLDAVVVVGRVFDSSGAVVTDAPVEARRQTTNQVFRTTTTETGDYTLVNLPADTYDIQISKTGFQTAKRASVRLEIGRTQRFDFTLSPGEVATAVEIQAEAPLLRTEGSELGATINTAQIRELPNSFRDWLGFLALVPGAAPIRGSYNGSGQAAGGYNVGGFRRSDNVMRIDGGVMMTSFGFTTYYPSLDAIQEMDVKVGLYGAEYGQRPGGQVNAIIKSGTNMPHGSVFEFLRNDKLDARTFFAPIRPPFKRSLFGATVGAPILLPKLFNGKDKAWFFFSYAGERRRELRILTGQVPELAERAGRFATDIIDPQTGQPFPNRTIPANRINPIATKLLAFWPEPNTAGRGFNFTSPTSAVRFNANEVISKVDVNVSSHDRWSGRFIFSTNPVDNTNVFSAFSTVDPLRTWAPSIINTRTFGARAVNEFGVYMFRRPGINGSKYSVANYSSTLAFPNWPVNTFDRNGVPNTTVTGLSPIGDTSNGGPVITGYWEVRDGFSFTKGAHSIRAGFNWLRSWNYWALEDRSKLNFIPRYSRNAIADFLLGYPANTLRGGDFLRWNEGQNTTSLYVQDYWKASSKLTVNFGLRYEYRSPLKDKRGFSGNFDPATGKLTPYQDLQLKPWETGRFTPDVPLVSWSKRGFLPRVGLAYRLAPRTVVRAGYGVYSNEPVLGMLQVVGQNFRPHSEDVTYLADAVRPTISLSDPFNPASADGSTLPNAFGVLPHMPQAITHSWGLTVQRELGWGTLLEVGYQGSNSIHQPHMITLNDARPGTAPRQQRRPFPQYQNITFTDAQDRVNVQGLEIRLERRAGREGLSFQVAYAKLKSLDTAGGRAAVGGDPAFTSVNSSRDRERGPGQGDIPGRLVIAAGYELPFGKGKPYLSTSAAGKILGGWSLQTIYSWQAGPYISAVVPFDRLDQGSTNSDRPDVLRNPNLDSSQRTLQRWFDTSAFVTPPATRYGNAGRGIVQGPGFTVADFAILRYFRITERARFELRGEAFNVTNKSNFGLPGTSFGTSTFGVISSSLPPRNIQLGLRFSF